MEIQQQEDSGRWSFYIQQDDEKIAQIFYTIDKDQKVVIHHTEVAMSERNKGLGKKLVAKVVEFARERKIKVLPICQFAKSVFQQTSSFKDVL